MEAVDDSGVAVIVHTHSTQAVHRGQQWPEGVQQHSHGAAPLTVYGVHTLLQPRAATQLSAALPGGLLLLDAGGHLGGVRGY